jgi:hypothetical protein
MSREGHIINTSKLNTIAPEDMDGEDNMPFVMDPIFDSKVALDEMRCLALVAHNHRKPAMKDFVPESPEFV